MDDWRGRTGEARRDALHAMALVGEEAGTLDVLGFFGHRGTGTGPWMLSQWWPVEFVGPDGVKYHHAEGWMMAAKARLFGQTAIAEAVACVRSPKLAKEMGRSVPGFDEATWTAARYAIVREGNWLKFSQHPELAGYLASTRGRLLAEASPYDRVWGIGVGVDHADAGRPSQWRGLNLLGYALVDVRDDLGRSGS